MNIITLDQYTKARVRMKELLNEITELEHNIQIFEITNNWK